MRNSTIRPDVSAGVSAELEGEAVGQAGQKGLHAVVGVAVDLAEVGDGGEARAGIHSRPSRVARRAACSEATVGRLGLSIPLFSDDGG